MFVYSVAKQYPPVYTIRFGNNFGTILKNRLITCRSRRDQAIEKEVMNMNRSKALILLTMVAVAAIFGGIVLTSYAAGNGEENSNGSPEWFNGRMMLGPCGWPRGGLRGRGGFGFVKVSEEFKQNVINIAESDEDVQNLLADDYNVTRVRPIIKSIVEADGNVETKATSAIVMLEKDVTGKAAVLVDLEADQVTKIVILTRTVIEKPLPTT